MKKIKNNIKAAVTNQKTRGAIYLCGSNIDPGSVVATRDHYETTLDFADKHDIEITKMYVITLEDNEIPTLKTMIQDFRNGEFDLLLTYGKDDLAMRYMEWLFVTSQLKRFSIPWLSVLEPGDIDDPFLKSLQEMLQDFNEFLLSLDAALEEKGGEDSDEYSPSESHTGDAPNNFHKKHSA